MTNKSSSDKNTVAINRRAYHNFEIHETYEAGLVLLGTEVKALRQGLASIGESYAVDENGELWLRNAHIAEYVPANRLNHEPTRPRKLLVKRRELNKLLGAIQREGMTIIPLRVYFNSRGRAKVAIGLARGRKLYDKRQKMKEKDWKMSRARILRNR